MHARPVLLRRCYSRSSTTPILGWKSSSVSCHRAKGSLAVSCSRRKAMLMVCSGEKPAGWMNLQEEEEKDKLFFFFFKIRNSSHNSIDCLFSSSVQKHNTTGIIVGTCIYKIYIVLYGIVSYCFVLYCMILYRIVLYHVILYRIVLSHISFCITWHQLLLYYIREISGEIVLYHIISHCIVS